MAYEKLNWQDGKAPAVSAENLNHMDNGIAEAQQTADKAKEMIDEQAPFSWRKLCSLNQDNGYRNPVEVNPFDFFKISELALKINNLEISASSGGTVSVRFSLIKDSTAKSTLDFLLLLSAHLEVAKASETTFTFRRLPATTLSGNSGYFIIERPLLMSSVSASPAISDMYYRVNIGTSFSDGTTDSVKVMFNTLTDISIANVDVYYR